MTDAPDLTTPFMPGLIYCDGDEDDPYLEYVNADVPVFYDRVDGALELVREMHTKKIVGVRIYTKLSFSCAVAP